MCKGHVHLKQLGKFTRAVSRALNPCCLVPTLRPSSPASSPAPGSPRRHRCGAGEKIPRRKGGAGRAGEGGKKDGISRAQMSCLRVIVITLGLFTLTSGVKQAETGSQEHRAYENVRFGEGS